MKSVRRAGPADAARIAEIEVFNYRLNFYPIFQNDGYYFGELQVPKVIDRYLSDADAWNEIYVLDDGAVKGFVRVSGDEIRKLFVEPVLQGQSIGAELLAFAVREKGARRLWALEKNVRAIAFYERNGFRLTGERTPEDDTEEYLVRMELCGGI